MCIVFVCFSSGVERARSKLDSLTLELEYSRRVAHYDSTHNSKVFEDSIKVEVAKEKLADEIEDSMEPNHGWVWFTVCIGVSATVMSIITLADSNASD